MGFSGLMGTLGFSIQQAVRMNFIWETIAWVRSPGTTVALLLRTRFSCSAATYMGHGCCSCAKCGLDIVDACLGNTAQSKTRAEVPT